MIVFDIRKTLVNVPTYTKDGVAYTVDAVCRGFNKLKIPKSGINEVELSIDLEFILNGVVDKVQNTGYQLHNDIWFNTQGEVVPRMISDTENEGQEIINPEAVINECDYWLWQMVNVEIDDRTLIEAGLERLDLVQHYWSNIQL